jgi:hypothetical protein
MANNIKDYEDVRSLIQLYIDGSNGDAVKLRAAFHPQARMAGHIGDLVSDNEPINDFITLIEATPGLAGPGYRAYVRSIDLDGDAGVAVLVESDYYNCDFVDYFSVARLDGRWQITNKTYAHTGGTPPPN